MVTGPSGSYREHDILNFLERHLGEWGPGSKWELFFADAYGPELTDNVQRACWLRGRVFIPHGGGASSVGQTNDTDLHLWTRKRFMELQQDLMIRKARMAGGGMADLTREENINIMIQVMSDKELHMRASRGYKYAGALVALDGSEDYKVCREAGEFWNEMNMRTRINSAVAEVEAQFREGKLPWTWKTVQSVITPYPKKGHIDVLLPGQEDEATEDPDGMPWEVEDKEVVKEGQEELPAGNEHLVDPADWHESHIPIPDPEHSDGEALHGDGVGLSVEQADVVIEHSVRLNSLKEAKGLVANVRGVVGASLTDTLNRVMHMETKRFNKRNRTDPAVQQEMKALIDAEETKFRRDRADLQEHMRQTKERDRARRELAEVTAQLKKDATTQP